MIISEKTQLGLGYKDDIHGVIAAMNRVNQEEGDNWGVAGGVGHDDTPDDLLSFISKDTGIDKGLIHLTDGDILRSRLSVRIFGNALGVDLYLKTNPGRCFLVASTVERCADMIRIGENFSTSIFKKLNTGVNTFLLGRGEFFKVIRVEDAVMGFYYNKDTKIAFEFGFDLSTDRYYFPSTRRAEFNRAAKIVTFVLLGDIQTILLAPGRDNNKTKKDGKIKNTSKFPVSIVDAKWNNIVVRTDGFAVMGHYRLQPVGAARADRKLIWINAFEKHGYTRRAGIMR